MISGTRYRLSVEINRQVALAGQVARAQAEISSEKRILAPSDDPTASATISGIALAQADSAAWLRNLDHAGALAARADNALSSVNSIVDRANELILSAASATLSAENRATIASELRGIAVDIAAIADSRDANGGPLFRIGAALEIPVHSGGTIAPVASRDVIFGNVQTGAGITDLVSIMNDAADAVEEPDPVLRRAATVVAIDAIGASILHVAAARGDQGVRANRVDSLHERLTLSGQELNEQRIGLEGVDLVEAIARLQAKQLSLSATQAVFARINQSSLFDLLR